VWRIAKRSLLLAGLSFVLSSCDITDDAIHLSNPGPAATNVTYDFSGTYVPDGSSWECIEVRFDDPGVGGLSKPTGMDLTNAALVPSSGVDAFNWTGWTVSVDNFAGIVALEAPSPQAEPSAGVRHIALGGITNPGFDGEYAASASFENTCGSMAKGGFDATFNVGYDIERESTVSVDVQPFLNFTVAGTSAACNGESQTPSASSSATAVSLGNVGAGQAAAAAQLLTATSNAQNGVTVTMRRSGNFSNGLHTFANVSGTNLAPLAFPGPSTEAFGYTTNATLSATGDGPTRFSGNKWAQLSTSNEEVLRSTAPGTTASCVGYKVSTAPETPAGTYSTTILYTAVPRF
jgi:hypothetical protein